MIMDHSIRSHRGISPRLGQRVYVDPAATVIGDVNLGDDASVWPGAVIRGDMHSIKIGARSNVQDNAVLHITHASDFNPDGWPLTIGDDVVIGHRAVLHGCNVGNRILIGNGAIVNDGAIIEVKGNEEIEYDGEIHSAANLYDALKEGYYGKF